MTRSKSIWAVLALLIVVLAVVVTACGGGGATTTSGAATTATSAPPATSAGSTESTAASSDTTAASTATTVGAPVTLHTGGTFALTGAYAEDCAAVLAGFQDYIKYVNDNKILAPWAKDKTIPANITFDVLWADDGLAPDKTLAIYEDFKSKGMLVERVSGSPEGMALKDKLIKDMIGATSQSTSPAYLTPPGNIYMAAPIYTDDMAAIASWFMDNWKDTSRKPRVAYLTADSTLGRNIVIPEMQAYLEKMGFEFVGAQFVPMVPTSPPTTQLAWLKDNKVDLALGVMINSGTQPTIKEATRMGMGPDLAYKITFGFAQPAHLQIFVPAMGESGNGVVVAGDFCAQDAQNDGVAFANLLQDTYRPNDKNGNVMYYSGIVEAMTQVEALRLAAAAGDPSTMTSADVVNNGFLQIKNLSTGDLTISPLTYGQGDVQGLDSIRLQQVQGGKIVEIGSKPMANIIPAPKQ
jgi:hypothetical protein